MPKNQWVRRLPPAQVLRSRLLNNDTVVDPNCLAALGGGGCGIGYWGAPGGRCLRMAHYVTGAGGHRRGDRRGKGLMLPMLSQMASAWVGSPIRSC